MYKEMEANKRQRKGEGRNESSLKKRTSTKPAPGEFNSYPRRGTKRMHIE